LDGHVHVTGSIKAPEAKAHVRGKAVAVQALQLGDLDAKLALAKGTLHIHQLDLQNKNSAVRVTGAVGLFHEPGFQAVGDPAFHLNIEEGRIALNNFHERARGNLAIAANLKGSLSKPMGTLRLEGTNLDFGVQKLDGLKLLVTLDGERLWVKPFQLVVAPGETVEGQGWVSLDRRFDMTLVSPGVSLEHIDLLDKKAAAKGTMRCNISLAGGWQDPQVHGEISLEGLQMWGQSMENMTVEVNMENQLARILARHHFNLEGTYDLTKRDFTVSLQLEDTDLEPYFRLAGQADFGGLATGKVEASGNLGAMDDLRASLDMRKLALSWQGKGLVHTENLKASVKDQYLSLWPVMLAVGTDGHLRLHGTARRNGPVAMEAQGEIPLAVLAPFIEPLPDLEGRLVLSAQVDGSQDRPQISAEVTMRQVGFTVPGLLQRLEALEGRVRIDSREIAIDHLGGKLDGGSFVLTGHVGTEAFRPTTIHAQIKADAVPVRLPDTLDLLLNTELNIEGTKEQATVQGEVAVLEGTYYKDVRLSFLPEAAGRRREETPPPEISHPLFRNTELDVSIKRRDPLIVDNNLAHLEINPDLRIVGKLDNPIIRGRATVESGTIQYRKKTFEVKKGVVDFSNPYKTEPHIDIEAETTVRHWTIVLALAGTPDALSFKLTSAPPEEDGDILSLLVMGRTTGELIAGEGGAGKSSAQMLAEAMAGALSDDIKKATGLDTLEVQVGTENGQDAVRVTVGKDLSRRMSVKYVTESKEGNIVERAVAEYKFLEHILFSGSQDTEGVFGGEVKYRLEFR
jgi:autotransporter translocation and assembly factor TamB